MVFVTFVRAVNEEQVVVQMGWEQRPIGAHAQLLHDIWVEGDELRRRRAQERAEREARSRAAAPVPSPEMVSAPIETVVRLAQFEDTVREMEQLRREPKLHPDDARYVVALAARLEGAEKQE